MVRKYRNGGGVIERHYSLQHAAAMLGIDRHTLKRWLVEAGFQFPPNPRRSKVALRERDIEEVVRRHRPERKPVVMRKAS